MDTISFKLSSLLKRRLAAEAARRRVPQSAIIRESLETALGARARAGDEPTCADLAGELVGSLRGPRDLASNRKHLEQALLKDLNRGRRRHR